MSSGSALHVITFVHGFTQTSRSWDHIISALGEDFDCTALDAPGHGNNTEAKSSLWECGEFISSAMPVGVLVGYSMGARMALHAALKHPEKVSALVFISGTAGLDTQEEREVRIASDENLADHIETVGVEQFITEWLQNPMFSGLSEENQQRPDRLRNSASGLANSLRYAGTGTQQPLWDQLHTLEMPVLIIAGANDQKFVDLAHRMQSHIPNSKLEVIPDAGHTVHLENTQEFLSVFTHFLSRTQSNN